MTDKRRLTFFDKLILWLNYCACAALLISYLAPVTDPRSVWFIAFFGLAYPPVLLVNLLFVIYWLIRKSKWALLSFLLIVADWKVLTSNIGFRSPVTGVENKDSTVFRMMSYNVHGFRKFGNEWNLFTMPDILSVIRHQQPDVLNMEEFFSRKGGKFAMVDSIKAVMQTPYAFFAPFPVGRKDGSGMVVFSRYPIVDTGMVLLNSTTSLNQCIYADIRQRKKTIRIYAVHLQSIHLDNEDYRYLDSVSKRGKTGMHGSKRIGSKLKTAFIKRSEQVSIIKKHMQQCPYPYIVAGDFNDTPSSYAVNQVSAGLQNAFRQKGSGLGRTYNGSFPNYQIDYIMTTKQFEILSYGVVKKKLSDHYPVYSDIRLKN